jgi:hypothetical protein
MRNIQATRGGTAASDQPRGGEFVQRSGRQYQVGMIGSSQQRRRDGGERQVGAEMGVDSTQAQFSNAINGGGRMASPPAGFATSKECGTNRDLDSPSPKTDGLSGLC